MSEGRDKYKNLLDKIEQLTSTDPEFRKAMEERFGQNSIYLNKIKQIEKYLGLDFSLDKIDSIIDYSFVDNEYVKLQLISDNREMLRYRYGTRGHKIDFLEFCRYAHMQAEMLVNYYLDKQYKGDIDKIVAAINYQYKTETTTLSSINYISKCIYVKKKFGIKGSNLENLAKVRNIQSHRSVGNDEVDLSYVEVIKKSGLYLNRDKDDFDWYKIQADAGQKNTYDTIYNKDEKYENYKINLWISKQPYDSVIETLNILAKMISTKVGIGEVVDLDKIKTFGKKDEEISLVGSGKKNEASMDKLTVISIAALEQIDKDILKEVVTTESEFGISACFFLKKGGRFYIPMDGDAKVGIGEVLDLDKIKIKTLEKRGEMINRVCYDVKDIDGCVGIDNDKKWKVYAIQHLTTLEDVRGAEWSQGEYGLSLKVYLKTGGYFFIEVSSRSSITKNTPINLDNFDLLFLQKGDDYIERLCLRGERTLDD